MVFFDKFFTIWHNLYNWWVLVTRQEQNNFIRQGNINEQLSSIVPERKNYA